MKASGRLVADSVAAGALEEVVAQTLCVGPNGYVCFRTMNGVPMGMGERKERAVRRSLKAAGIMELHGRKIR